MANHGIFVTEQQTTVSTPVVAATGVPFVVGCSPIQAAEAPAAVGVPVLLHSFEEAVEKFGYSDDWAKYQLCEFFYSQFKHYGVWPVIAVNLLAPETMKQAVVAADKTVADHRIELPLEAIDSDALVVKAAGGTGDPKVKGTDYEVFYGGEKCVIALKATGSIYDAASLSVAYDAATPASVDATAVATGMEAIELCATTLGMVPDLIVAPGYSDATAVAAVMATKAAGINGMFRAKALIDISTAESGGADEYGEVVALKGTNGFTDANQLPLWPLVKKAGKVFHYSTHMAGLIAATDQVYGAPHVSPSNKGLQIDAIVNAAGAEINLTLAQANALNAGGVITAINFMGGWKAWGNYTGAYPANTDVKDYLIPVSRMFDFVGNTIIRTYWSKLDMPMNRRLMDSILDSVNIWLNGLTGAGYLLGGRAEILETENPLANLMAGKIKFHLYLTPPSPAQEIEFVQEYDAAYVVAEMSA